MPAASSAIRFASKLLAAGVREEELLAVDLVVGDRLLALGGDQPVDESLAHLLLDVRMLRRIDEHHAVLVVEALVALDHDREVATVLEGKPGAAVGEDVGAHPAGGIQRRTHALTGIAVPGALLFCDVDARKLPDLEL